MNDPLDSRQLKTLTVLAKNGSVTQTARELCVTHSAISHSLRNLEGQVGCRLLCRLGKKVTLTEAGEALVHYAERALSEMQQARVALTDLSQWGSRRLRLAAEAIFPPAFLSPVLLDFHRAFPRSVLQLETCPPGQAASLLARQAVDLVLAAKPPAAESWEFHPLLADGFHMVVNAGHVLAGKSQVSRAEIAAQSCIFFRGCGHERPDLETLLGLRDITLNIAGEVESLETVKQLVQQTQLMSLLPGWVIAPELRDRRLVPLRFGRKPIEQSWGLLHARARPLNHAESVLWKFCGQQIASLA